MSGKPYYEDTAPGSIAAVLCVAGLMGLFALMSALADDSKPGCIDAAIGASCSGTSMCSHCGGLVCVNGIWLSDQMPNVCAPTNSGRGR